MKVSLSIHMTNEAFICAVGALYHDVLIKNGLWKIKILLIVSTTEMSNVSLI